jgi:catechol 2,3-dioxygenase-like lactoylglutathione lyase family enzyme
MNRSEPTPKLTGIVPSILVAQLRKTLEFYGTLGFTLTGCHPDSEAPTWAEVARGRAVLQFYTEPPRDTANAPVLSGTIYVQVQPPEALAAELQTKVEFEWGPEEMDYGTREFCVRDPDGYLIAFTESA